MGSSQARQAGCSPGPGHRGVRGQDSQPNACFGSLTLGLRPLPVSTRPRPTLWPWACGRLELGAEERSSLLNPLLTTRTPLYCQNPAVPLVGHTLLCSSSGPADHSHQEPSGAVLPAFGQTEAEVVREGKWGWPQRGLPDAAWWDRLRTRTDTFIPSHSLASLAGTEDRIRVPTICSLFFAISAPTGVGAG